MERDTEGKVATYFEYKGNRLGVNIFEPVVNAISTYFVVPWITFITTQKTHTYDANTVRKFMTWLQKSREMYDVFNMIVQPQIDNIIKAATRQWDENNNKVTARSLCGIHTVIDMKNIRVGKYTISGPQLCGLIERIPGVQEERFRRRLEGEEKDAYVRQFVDHMKATLILHIEKFLRAEKPLPEYVSRRPLASLFSPPPSPSSSSLRIRTDVSPPRRSGQTPPSTGSQTGTYAMKNMKRIRRRRK